MIRLNVSEQQLFDIIMAVYATGTSEEAQSPEAAQRREALLEKLHRAFDAKIIAPHAEQMRMPVRMTAGSSDAVAAAGEQG